MNSYVKLIALSGSEAGLVLSSIIFMATIFYYGVQKLAELENMMISTERVIEYGNLPAEAALESSKGIIYTIYFRTMFL